MEDGPRFGLHLNVEKTEIFWPTEDPRSRQVGVFPPNIARPLNGVKLLGAPATSDLGFSSELVMQRVTKSIALMDKVAKLDDPQCELLLLRACTGVSKLYFTLRTCPPSIFKAAQRAFDEALRSSLERIVTASGPGFGDWQWRLATLPFAFGGLGVYSAGDVRHYAFLASRLQSAGLQTKLLRHTGNPSEVAAPILMKKLADVYFTKTKFSPLSLLFTHLLATLTVAIVTIATPSSPSPRHRRSIKIGCGKLSKAKFVIGQMYDDVLITILSVISIKDAMVTGGVATRWRYLWFNLRLLNFDGSENFRNKMGLVDVVNSRKRKIIKKSHPKLQPPGRH
ncbi:uncharacterized protein [Rutidosis leptorrhynchoides]|uniref:uncharacterized protein n=1 Tax=Rutidosis leptorrhynchoides TaxID=125765 RepID=UPI003A9A2DCC